MLIDDSSKIAKLSTSIAGSDLLQPIYHFLWHRLNSLHEKVLEVQGKMYLLYGKIVQTPKKVSLQYVDSQGNIQ